MIKVGTIKQDHSIGTGNNQESDVAVLNCNPAEMTDVLWGLAPWMIEGRIVRNCPEAIAEIKAMAAEHAAKALAKPVYSKAKYTSEADRRIGK
jgi:hypothetical protein